MIRILRCRAQVDNVRRQLVHLKLPYLHLLGCFISHRHWQEPKAMPREEEQMDKDEQREHDRERPRRLG